MPSHVNILNVFVLKILYIAHLYMCKTQPLH